MIRTQAEFDYLMARLSDRAKVAAVSISAADVRAIESKVEQDADARKLLHTFTGPEWGHLRAPMLEGITRYGKVWAEAEDELHTLRTFSGLGAIAVLGVLIYLHSAL